IEIIATDRSGELDVRLESDPVQLQQLVVEVGRVEADLLGVVVDAVTGEPLPWADLQLTTDAVDQVGRRKASDEEGRFELPGVLAGPYLLRVDKLGYLPQFRSLLHASAGPLVEVKLEPDSAMLRGLAAVRRDMEVRRREHPRQSVVI